MPATSRPFRPVESGPPRVVPQRRVACGDAVATDPVLAAEAEAAAILVSAEDVRERMRSEGYAAGMAHAESDLREMQQALASSIGELSRERDQVMGQAAQYAAELAIELAAEWTGQSIARDPAQSTHLIERALRAAPVGSTAIRVSPDVAGNVGEIGLRVLPDPSLRPGDVVIESPSGELDARLCVMREMLINAVRGLG